MIKQPLLNVKNLSTIFRTDEGIVKAVSNLSFHVNEKEIMGIVGESGCGKSVTNLSILSLVPSPPGKITDGDVLFEGKDILNIPEPEKRTIRGKKISMIFQDPLTSLNPYLKISTQIIEGLMLHEKLSKKNALEKCIEILKKVGISDPEKRIFRYPHEYSGGMRQRVMIAMALSTNPSLLIADEPTTALDVTIQSQILDLIKELQKTHNMSVILITHDMGVVAGMCNRIIVMYAGHIVEENKAGDLFKNPSHPYTSGLLKSIPSPDKDDKEKLFSINGSPPNLIDLPDACPFYPRCDRAKQECKEKMPQLKEISADHRLACYNPL